MRTRSVVAATVVVVVVGTAAVVLAVRDTGGTGTDNGRRSCTTSTTAATSWVTRSGSKLLLDGRTWRFSGVNEYWLGLRDGDAAGDAGAAPSYPSGAEIDDGLAAAQDVGARVVRSTSLGVSVGNPKSIEPSLGTFNDDAFASIDHAVAEARRCGLRLMIPLTDQHHYYHGGKHTFTNWLGHPDVPGASLSDPVQKAREQAFYTDGKVIDAYQDYIAHVLDHVNPETKLRLGDDPTIAIWETGNEIYDAPTAWTQQIATFIRTKAPKALVADGGASSGKDITQTGVDQSGVDIVDAHYYPRDAAQASKDAAYVAGRGKAFVIGEFPLTGAGLSAWTTSVADDPDIAGDAAWSLLPYDAGGRPVNHDDGYTFHVPGATDAERAQVETLRTHAGRMAGN